MTTCFDCDQPATQDHHVVPVSLGGVRTVPLCDQCHALVHDRRAVSISTLTRQALERKKAKGQRTGQVPYGSQLGEDGVHLEDNAQERRVIAVIQRMRAEGLSLCRIAKRLDEYAVPARGTKWHTTTIFRILSRNKWTR